MMPRMLLALSLLLWGASCTPAQPPPANFPDKPTAQDFFVLEDKPIPTKAEWLERLIQQQDEEPDLIEAATVLACDRQGIRRPYTDIQRDLVPFVASARKRLRPSSTADEKIAALNDVVLPAIHEGLANKFAWLANTFQAPDDETGKAGRCFVSSLLYLIAAEMLQLRVEMFPLPHHVALCHITPARRRNIECTDQGQHLGIPQYRLRLLKTDPDNIESVPEVKAAEEKYCAPLTRRQLTAAMVCQSAGRGPSTEESLKAATRLAPNYSYPWKILSGYYCSGNRYADAEEAASKGIACAPDVPALYAARAMNRMLQNKLEPALEDIERALDLSPRYPKYHQSKGLILIQADRSREASAWLAKAVEGAPHSAEFWWFRGVCHAKLKEYREAAEAYTRAILIDPKNGTYYDRRAKMWAMLGDEERWEADSRKAKELGGVRD
jgi:tetratricopeptide (TPR) repeat protein